MSGIAELAGGIGCAALAALWMGIIAPMVARVLGVPMAVGFWRIDRKNRHLSKRQYVLAVGVFTFGVGLFVDSAASHFLTWSLMGDQLLRPRPVRVLSIALISNLLLGALFGVMTAPSPNLEQK